MAFLLENLALMNWVLTLQAMILIWTTLMNWTLILQLMIATIWMMNRTLTLRVMTAMIQMFLEGGKLEFVAS